MAVSVVSDATSLACTSIGTAISSTAMSGSLWFYTTSVAAGYKKVFQLTLASNSYYIELALSGALLYLENYSIATDIYTSLSNNISANTWYWIGFWMHATNGCGFEQATDVAVQPTTIAQDATGLGAPGTIAFTKLGLGKDFPDTTRYLPGRVTALKLWNATLTKEELHNERWFIAPVRTANLWTWNPLTYIAHLNDFAGDSTGGAVARNLTGGSATIEGPPVAWRQRKEKSVFVSAAAAPATTLPQQSLALPFPKPRRYVSTT